METGPIHDRCWSVRCDSFARGGRVAPVDRVRAWPVYGDYLQEQNRRLGPLGGAVEGGGTMADIQRGRDTWEAPDFDGIALGDVPAAPVRERAEGSRVETVRRELAPVGRLIDVIV